MDFQDSVVQMRRKMVHQEKEMEYPNQPSNIHACYYLLLQVVLYPELMDLLLLLLLYHSHNQFFVLLL